MGYWTENEETNGVWGDSPADETHDWVDQVVVHFVRDMGRLPSRTEIREGLEFHLRARALPEKPSDSPDLSEDDLSLLETAYKAESPERLSEVIEQLQKPYETKDGS